MKIYFYYILLSALYPIVKVVYYVNGFVYLRGVIYGIIAGILTTCIGIFAFREYKKESKPVGHWLATLIPLIVIPLTPIIMVIHLGSEMLQMEKITVLVIFECLAITQIILAILMFRSLMSKRGTNQPRKQDTTKYFFIY